jgi:hypothetical protein
MTTWPTMPDCGSYLVWPCEGLDWIHPDDIELANRWIPSNRVFLRTHFDGEHYHLKYGDARLRVRPTMWLTVPNEGFEVGDQVEILGHFQENDPCIGRITEIRFDKPHNRILYTVETRELVLPRTFLATDLMPIHRRIQLREPD